MQHVEHDDRGTGLSDPVQEPPTLEERLDDVRAVLDAAGCERAAIWDISEGGPMAMNLRWIDGLTDIWGSGQLSARFAPSIFG